MVTPDEKRWRREMRRIREETALLAHSSVKLADRGIEVLRMVEAGVPGSEAKAVVIVLSGRLPAECVQQIRVLVQGWSQDLHIDMTRVDEERSGDE